MKDEASEAKFVVDNLRAPCYSSLAVIWVDILSVCANIAARIVAPSDQVRWGRGEIKKSMAVKIRLKRMGKKKMPSYRVVVADARSPRDGRIIEKIGWYNPLSNPSTLQIDEEKALHWLNNGAQPTEVVVSLLKRTGTMERFEQAKAARKANAQQTPAE